jgi:hypothetical protein
MALSVNLNYFVKEGKKEVTKRLTYQVEGLEYQE